MSHNHALVSFLAFLPEDPKVDFPVSIPVATSKKIGIRKQSFVNAYAGTIWQPPKIG